MGKKKVKKIAKKKKPVAETAPSDFLVEAEFPSSGGYRYLQYTTGGTLESAHELRKKFEGAGMGGRIVKYSGEVVEVWGSMERVIEAEKALTE